MLEALFAAYPAAMKAQLPEVFALPEEHFAATEVMLPLQTIPRDVSRFFMSGQLEVIFSVGPTNEVMLTARWLGADVTGTDAATTVTDALKTVSVAFMCLVLGNFLRSTLWPSPVIFPAERVGVQLFAREIGAERSRALNEMLVRTGTSSAPDDVNEPMPVGYPLAISDFQQSVLAPRHPLLKRAKKPSLANVLEDEILSGDLTFDPDGAVTLTPRGGGPSLPLASTSSLTKALAQLVAYFRQRAPSKSVLLIIDEPESNLHPERQVQIARFLARVVHAGFRVMVSTHSDYIIRELNHCIMASHTDKTIRAAAREMGYPETVSLKPKDVGAYHVRDGLAERLEVTSTGFRVPSIDAVIEKQTDVSQRFYAAIDALEEAPAQEPT